MSRFVATGFLLAALAALAALAVATPAQALPPPWGLTGEGASRGEDLSIRLVTFGPGNDITEWFGHSAIVVEDTAKHDARLYNYGEFAFDDKTAVRYVMGRLEFHVGERGFGETLQKYRAHNRSETIQDLDLTPAERLGVARFLANNALPENATYLYDHYSENCATRPRDVIDRAVAGQLHAAATPARMTLREHTLRMTEQAPWLSIPIDFALNGSVDRPITTWEEAFLPGELQRSVAALQVTRADGTTRPLVSATHVVYEAQRPPLLERPASELPWLGGAGVLLAGLIFALRRRLRALGAVVLIVGSILGVAGTALFMMATLTDHAVARYNENLFLANPLTLLLAPTGAALLLGWASGERVLQKLAPLLAAVAAVGMAAKLTPWAHQQNGPFVALMLPVVVALVVAARTRR